MDGCAADPGMIVLWMVLILPIVFTLLALAAFAFWVWMLVDVVQNPRLSDNNRLMWVLIVVLTQIIGALIYCIVERPKQKRCPATPPTPPGT